MMAITLLKTTGVSALRPLSLIAVSVGGLALFLIIASLLLVSKPLSSTIHEYLLNVNQLREPSLVLSPRDNQTGILFQQQQPSEKWNQGMTDVASTSSKSYINGTASSNIRIPKLRSCDLYHGKWMLDPAGPLYTNNTCPIITPSQNCQGNGRPDKDYENWRWKPDRCDLPRFDARKFLELMKGKTLAFVGDSLARNQMESILCILWQVDVPKRLRKRQMRQWHFRSTSTTILLIKSHWLVHRTIKLQGLVHVHHVHLDIPDDTFMEPLPKFDAVILSSGHWFFKQTAYLLQGKIVGGQRWPIERSGEPEIDNIKAYGIAIKTALTAIATMPNYTGLTIFRTYSPDHYRGRAWDAGNLCGRMGGSDQERDGHADVIHKKQVLGFAQASKKVRNGSKMRLMDITEAFRYRHDGHPGPYWRSFETKMVGKGGSSGDRPLVKDCGHWCVPGPIDTWNEILFEILRREF